MKSKLQPSNHASIPGSIVSIILVVWMGLLGAAAATAAESYVTDKKGPNYFPLVVDGKSASLHVSSKDFAGVHRVAGQLRDDIGKVTGVEPSVVKDDNSGETIVIIGTIGKSPVIDQLISEKKIDASEVSGRWDTFALQPVSDPLPGVKQALVIFGSNKRGTIYGMYDLATHIGVSPWHFWADAPITHRDELYVKPGFHTMGEPKVKYRGIFINDEAPALTGWVGKTFGGFNHEFYETVFELIMRNKGNYLWPAMWQPRAFAADDPENARLADEYGLVISTSHHEPMMRAHAEWGRSGGGAWNYETNKEKLQEFWRGGIERMGDFESVVTLGMRGDGDEAMSESTAVDLLQTIVADQRKIISEVTGKPAEETSQVWAVYKEVQDYYDMGMRVPDDITILFCDDNWGNIRILPKKEDLDREGGFGIYYHFDFVGGPVSYRWLNVTQIERIWEQMNLAYEWGVRDIWLVNVGDIKPMELPISFWLDFAWNPEAIDAKDLPRYYTDWAAQQFGDEFAKEAGELLALYTKYNARRTPEMLKPDTYSLVNYREADRVVDDYVALRDRARALYEELPESHKASFYQLVLSPIELCCNLNEMYLAAAKNMVHAEQGRASANYYANRVQELFDRDAELTRVYHQEMAGGKWDHMMSQKHIGYTSWNEPRRQQPPNVTRVEVPDAAALGFVVEHGASTEPQRPERQQRPGPGRRGGPGGPSVASQGLNGESLPIFDPLNDQRYYIEIFNKGEAALEYTVSAKQDWIKLSSNSGTIERAEKVFVSIDWSKAPEDSANGEIEISGAGTEHTVKVPIRTEVPEAKGFIERNGVVSIEAAAFDNSVDMDDAYWTVVPNMGRTGSAVTPEPANADPRKPGEDAPRLEYTFTLLEDSDVELQSYLLPTLDFKKGSGLKFAVAIDDEEPQIVNMNEGESQPDWTYPRWWNDSVTDRNKIRSTRHEGLAPGTHTLKVWMIDPGVVFQKFVINAGGLRPSYLGPPVSSRAD